MKKAWLLVSGATLLFLHAQTAQGEEKGIQPLGGRSGFAAVNGVKLNYLEWPGPKGGAKGTLVLIHGFGDSPHIFDDFALRFQDSFRVIAYARRGHASSEAPAGPYDSTRSSRTCGSCSTG